MTTRTMSARAAAYLLRGGPMTCSGVGAQLWGRQHRKPQAYARPAGKLLRFMARMGVVEQKFDGSHFFEWHLLPGWEKKLESLR